MRRCAFLTLENPPGFVIDDELAYEPLGALGWHVEAIPWTRLGVKWTEYDAVVIRSTWDYYKEPDHFLSVLESIEHAGTRLMNPLELVRWNVRKTYLQDLHARGLSVVPTVFRDRLCAGNLWTLADELGTDEVVVKPLVGASAIGAFYVTRENRELSAEVEAYYADRELMVQPFARHIATEGEYSLFYFNAEYSHAVVKTPSAGDFRVQEEHGGCTRPFVADAQLRVAGDEAIRAIREVPLYARADFVRAGDGLKFWLMELELIEPSLYFGMESGAAERFALAFGERVRQRSARAIG